MLLAIGAGREHIPAIHQRLRKHIEEAILDTRLSHPVSLSFGVSLFLPEKKVTLESLLEEADRHLYRCKRGEGSFELSFFRIP